MDIPQLQLLDSRIDLLYRDGLWIGWSSAVAGLVESGARSTTDWSMCVRLRGRR